MRPDQHDAQVGATNDDEPNLPRVHGWLWSSAAAAPSPLPADLARTLEAKLCDQLALRPGQASAGVRVVRMPGGVDGGCRDCEIALVPGYRRELGVLNDVFAIIRPADALKPPLRPGASACACPVVPTSPPKGARR